MAGSFRHMTTKHGKLRNNESFTDLIENLGDAYEAAEECFGMIWVLAAQVTRQSAGTSSPTREQILATIRRAEVNYQEGLGIGGVQRHR
jgi:hypothetical protein